MLRIVNLEEIEGLLRRVPPLIDQMERRDPEFANSVRCWMRALEGALESNRMAISGEVAALRGVLASAERGMIPENMSFSGRVTNRILRDAVAADVLRQATSAISEIIRNDQARVEESDRIARQMLAIARAKGTLGSPNFDENGSEALKYVWKALHADPNTAQGAVNIESLVGPHDAIIVLDRAMARDGAR